MAKNVYMNQKIQFETVLFGKKYFWMIDPTGETYLVKEKDGLPDLSSL